MVELFLKLDEDGFVEGYGVGSPITKIETESKKIEVEEGHDIFETPRAFRLDGGVLVRDETKAEKEAEKQRLESMTRSRQKEAEKKLMEKLASDYLTSEEVPEEEKELFVNLYEPWKPNEQYEAGDIVSFGSDVFEVIQAHTSQSDWKPKDVPALFKVVYQTKTSGGEVVIPDFKQPTGGHDAYKKGDRVMFEGKAYESTIDNNVWSPTGYPQGWKEIG